MSKTLARQLRRINVGPTTYKYEKGPERTVRDEKGNVEIVRDEIKIPVRHEVGFSEQEIEAQRSEIIAAWRNRRRAAKKRG